MDKRLVTYEDFGACGDGKTDDFEAIYKAHIYANENKLPVAATAGKTYCIRETVIDGELKSIPIKTDVDWTGAEFIIDDTDIDAFDELGKKKSQIWIFTVLSDHETVTVSKSDPEYTARLSALDGIGYTNGTKKIDLSLGYPAMLVIYDENKGVYRRSGDSYAGSRQQTFGSAQHELLIVDKDGNIDGSTPFMFDYDEITKIDIIRLDIEPLTLKGGKFTTIVPRCDAEITVDGVKKSHPYYARGLKIKRSYTTVMGVEHYVEGGFTVEEYAEGLETTHYAAFFAPSDAAHVSFLNCTFTGRCAHIGSSYEFNATCVGNLTVKDCKQSNFFVNERGEAVDYYSGIGSMDTLTVPEPRGGKVLCCWGVSGTNFCKNFSVINSQFSRFDAHQGCYNGRIEGCDIQYMEIIGKGDFILKDTNIYLPTGYAVNSLFYLRGDYGCTWEGTIKVENVKVYINRTPFYIFLHSFSNFDYGYKCHIPSMELRGLEIFYKDTRESVGEGYELDFFTANSMSRYPYMHTADLGGAGENKNPITPPKYLKILDNDLNYKFRVPNVPFFDGTELVGVTLYDL